MRNKIIVYAKFGLIFCISLISIVSIASNSDSQSLLLERTLLFDMGDGGSRFYRIPAIVTAADGSLVVVADRRWDRINDLPSHIDVVARRSEDNGKTWSDVITIAGNDTDIGYGDPAIVLDKNTGSLLCIFASGNGLWQSNEEDLMRIKISRSVDNGKIWSPPADITDQIYGKNCQDERRRHWYGAFAASGRALQLRDGRIMFAMAVRTTPDWGGSLNNYVCYSDDGGVTWDVSTNAADLDGDEAKLIELNDGTILMSIRNREKGKRKFCLSKDRGETWGKTYLKKDIQDPACNGDIIRYSSIIDGAAKNILLHSIPDDASIRKNVSILVSFDEGKSWPVKRMLCSGLSAYSSMTVLSDGTIGVVVEEGKWDDALPGDDGFKLWFMRFTYDWLISSDTSE